MKEIEFKIAEINSSNPNTISAFYFLKGEDKFCVFSLGILNQIYFLTPSKKLLSESLFEQILQDSGYSIEYILVHMDSDPNLCKAEIFLRDNRKDLFAATKSYYCHPGLGFLISHSLSKPLFLEAQEELFLDKIHLPDKILQGIENGDAVIA